jgi:hypothetical protein
MRLGLALVGLLVGCAVGPVLAQLREAPRRAVCCGDVDFLVYVGAPRHPSPGCGTAVYLFDRRVPPGELLTVEAVPRSPRVDGPTVFVPARVADVDALWEAYPRQRTMLDPAGIALCRGTFPVTFPSAEGGTFTGQGAFEVYHLPGMKRDRVQLLATPEPGAGRPVLRALDWRRVR